MLDPPLAVIPEKWYGPQLPLGELVTHRAGEPSEDGRADVGFELERGAPVERGVPLVRAPVAGAPVVRAPVAGELMAGDCELGGEDGAAEVRSGVPSMGDTALRVGVPQLASTTTVAAAAIAGQICFGFTGKLLYLGGTPTNTTAGRRPLHPLRTPLGH